MLLKLFQLLERTEAPVSYYFKDGFSVLLKLCILQRFRNEERFLTLTEFCPYRGGKYLRILPSKLTEESSFSSSCLSSRKRRKLRFKKTAVFIYCHYYHNQGFKKDFSNIIFGIKTRSLEREWSNIKGSHLPTRVW